MKAVLLRDMVGIREGVGPNRYERYPMPMGTRVSSSDCYMLVKLGVARPDDDECFEACGKMNAEQIAIAGMQYDANDAGIQPGHRALFYEGKVTGYHPETGKFLVTEKFSREDAEAFPEDAPEDFLDDDDEGDEDE